MGLVAVATTNGTDQFRGAANDALDSQYRIAAIEYTRSLVDPLPGSGPTRGVWYFNGTMYAFRDDELGLECKMFEGTTSGWSEVATGVTLLPGGRYEFINHNFYGHTGLKKMYGVDGKNKAFEFDGTTFTQISTGMTDDTPRHVFAHKNYLFLAFSGGSVQHSSAIDPTSFSAVLGAGEIGIGEEVTGFSAAPGNNLFIIGRNSSHVLYGANSTANPWDLKTINPNIGAVEWTIQRFNYPLFLDDSGIISMDAVQEYGDYKAKTKSKNIQRLLNTLKKNTTGSVRVKDKDQYRIFFEDEALIFSFDSGRLKGISFSRYNISPRVPVSVEDENGDELLLFGCDLGYVYRMDSGTSFDGQPVEAWIRPMFNHFGSPENNKQFFKTVLEIEADSQADLTFLPEFGYGDTQLPTSSETAATVIGGGGIWDSPSTVWEDFYYDAQIISTAFGYTEGFGPNFSLFIRSESTYDRPHTIQGAIIHYSVKGLKR